MPTPISRTRRRGRGDRMRSTVVSRHSPASRTAGSAGRRNCCSNFGEVLAEGRPRSAALYTASYRLCHSLSWSSSTASSWSCAEVSRRYDVGDGVGCRRAGPRGRRRLPARCPWSVRTSSISPSLMRKPPDLDLVVDAPDELQLAVLVPPHQVTGAVHTRTGLRSVRVRHEPLGRQAGLVQVAAGHTGPRDVQLPHHTRRHQLQAPTPTRTYACWRWEAPIGGAPAPPDGIAAVDQMVVSVGPYRLVRSSVSVRIGSASGVGSASPPTRMRKPRRASRLVRHQELPQRGGALYDRDAVPGDQGRARRTVEGTASLGARTTVAPDRAGGTAPARRCRTPPW